MVLSTGIWSICIWIRGFFFSEVNYMNWIKYRPLSATVMVLESAWTSWLILAQVEFCSCWLHLMKCICFSTFYVDWAPPKVLAEGTAFNFSAPVFKLPELRWKLYDFSRALSLNWYLPKEFYWVCKDSWPHVRAPYQTKTDYAMFWIC